MESDSAFYERTVLDVASFCALTLPAETLKPRLIKDVLWVLEPSDSKHSWGDQDPTNGGWGQFLYMED